MIVVAIDPGSYRSGIVIIDIDYEIHDSFLIENNLGIIVNKLSTLKKSADEDISIIIEGMSPYGKKVGKETFDTIEFIGRMIERFPIEFPAWGVEKILRKAVLAHHDKLYSAMSDDTRIRKILIDRFGKDHTKKLIKDCWQAFALGVMYIDRQKEK